ncbi:MAG TPA: nitroreductase/quinone reductase family protein [Solirubrobacteraceae bacterium]|nr:nitroreductase/quinone reductase family protein [Solirubrobacteraceae bacterium]
MERAAVESAEPPRAAIRVMNPMLKAILRSPLHRLASGQLMLLTVTGRKTGNSYTIPVGRHQSADGAFLISAGGAWRHNLRGGADVRVTLDGRERTAHAVLEEDPTRAAEVFKEMLDRSNQRMLAVKVNVKRSPTAAEIEPALVDRGVAYLRLID